MPLKHSSSDKAFKANLKAELGAGKPKDQALAIAYSVQRESSKKKKKKKYLKESAMNINRQLCEEAIEYFVEEINKEKWDQLSVPEKNAARQKLVAFSNRLPEFENEFFEARHRYHVNLDRMSTPNSGVTKKQIVANFQNKVNTERKAALARGYKYALNPPDYDRGKRKYLDVPRWSDKDMTNLDDVQDI